MKTLRVAILGQGRSGRNIHGAHILQDGRFRVCAVVDPIADRRERAMREYGWRKRTYTPPQRACMRAETSISSSTLPRRLCINRSPLR